MTSKVFFSLNSIKPQKNYESGNITTVTSDEMPGLVNLSFAALKLQKNGSVEPSWHPNANKVGYCLEGNALVSIRTPAAAELFTISKGEVFFIPQGYIHHIVNTGDKETTIIFALNNDKPELMTLSNAMFSLSDNVFKETFNIPPDLLKGLKKTRKQDLIHFLPTIKPPNFISSRFKFNLAASSQLILTKGGYVQAATKTNLPILNGLGILGFGLNPRSAVEPHWHTNAGELIYILKGKTHITVLSPDGNLDELEVKAGEGAFAAASHFHNIQNIGEDNVEVMAFFSNAEPDYIGFGEVIGAYSNEILASIFNVTPTYFDTLAKPKGPLVIVPV